MTEELLGVEESPESEIAISIRNVWLLMYYASDLFSVLPESSGQSVEEAPSDVPDLVANILCSEVERRVHRNLTMGFLPARRALTRVKGRIDIVETMAKRLIDKGQVFCSFTEMTVNTPRNRLVLAALESLVALKKRSPTNIYHKCQSLARVLRANGVAGHRPTRFEVSAERFGRNDSHDREMVAAAHLALELGLPLEEAGSRSLRKAARLQLPKLFERGIYGFYKTVLGQQGWAVTSCQLKWRKHDGIEGVQMPTAAGLPVMHADIMLQSQDRKVIIDTKYMHMYALGRALKLGFRSGHIYQILAYLNSVEGSDYPKAEGILLYPRSTEDSDRSTSEFVVCGRRLRFATVDLKGGSREIRDQLMALILESP